MKLNKLSMLCAVACAGFAGHASAQLSTVPAAAAVVNDANTNGRVVYISGASAVQAGFNAIAGKLLQPTGQYTFTPLAATGRTGNDYRAIAGKLLNAADGWAAGSNVIIINRARGGSVFGVDAVARATSIESLDVTQASCTGGSGTAFTCGLNNRVPDAGVSDVAPKLFDGAYNTEGEPFGAPALSASELALLTPNAIYGLAFGVPLTNNLSTTLKLTKPAVSAIFTGNVGTWNQVDSTLAADDILLCRRTNGSGTQAVANLYFGNYPCDTGARNNAPADRNSGAAWTGSGFLVEGATGALNVVENASSGNVRDCLNNANVASTKPFNAAAVPGTLNGSGTYVAGVGYTGYATADRAGNPVAVNFRDGVAHKAIGVLSMDSLNTSTAAAGGWSFRALDGAGQMLGTLTGTTLTGFTTSGTGRLPTLDNLKDGTWDQQGWVSINVPARTTGNKLGLMNDFITAAKDPAIINSLPALKFVAAAVPGTPDPSATGNVLRAGYANNGDQCAPLNRNN